VPLDALEREQSRLHGRPLALASEVGAQSGAQVAVLRAEEPVEGWVIQAGAVQDLNLVVKADVVGYPDYTASTTVTPSP